MVVGKVAGKGFGDEFGRADFIFAVLTHEADIANRLVLRGIYEGGNNAFAFFLWRFGHRGGG